MRKSPLVELVKEKPVIFIVTFLVLVLLIILSIIGDKSLNRRQNSGDFASPTSSAYIVYKDAPYLPTKNRASDALVRDDLAFYARQTIPAYDPTKNPTVVFNVSEFSTVDVDTVTFSGKFEEYKKSIKVTVKKLKNDQIKTNIKADKTDVNIDDSLPSNNKKHQFIASLPLGDPEYTVSYLPDSDILLITIFKRDQAIGDRAYDAIKTALGDEFRDDQVSISFPTASFESDSSSASPNENETYSD